MIDLTVVTSATNVSVLTNLLYGVDVSAYQPNFDFAACRREGFDFAIIKATEGTGWRNSFFADQLARARAAGLLVAAYHYVRGGDVRGQLANIRSMVDTDTPVILDVEEGAGSIQSIRELNSAVNRAGYRTPLIYIPRWYWQGHMGSPNLAGLPPNWHSRYPDNTVRRKDEFVLGPEYWPTFGGLPTLVAQFTSSLAVANYPAGRIDGNAFQGSRAEFAALLGDQEDDMLTDAEKKLMFQWLEDTLRRVQSMHVYGFRPFDPDKNPPPSWRVGGDLTFLEQKLAGSTAPVLAKLAELSDDEAKLIAVIRAQPTGGQVDVDKLVPELTPALAGALAPLLPPGVTQRDVERALANVLRGGTDSVPTTNTAGEDETS